MGLPLPPQGASGLRRRVDGGMARAYRWNMDSGRFRCRAVALIAAYAVAMQALLSAFLPVFSATSAAPFAVLCSHDGAGADGSGQPLQHDLPCTAMCAALAHGVAGPLPPDIVVAVTRPQAVLAHAPVSDWVPPRTAIRGPQAPRAPPLA